MSGPEASAEADPAVAAGLARLREIEARTSEVPPTPAGSPAPVPRAHPLFSAVIEPMAHRWSPGSREEAARQLAANSTLTFAWNTTPIRFEVLVDDDLMISVCSTIAENVRPSAALFVWLSEVNAGVVTARVFYEDGFVVAMADAPLSCLAPPYLDHLAWAVGSLAEWAITGVAEEFGGDRYVHPSPVPWPFDTSA